MYIAAGKPVEYEQLTVPLLISGYLMVVVAEKTSVHPLMMQHLQDLKADEVLYMARTPSELSTPHGSSNWNKEEVKLRYR